jgi:superfamily II DNA/RNA helicase
MTNEIVTFDSLGLDDRLLRAIHKLGWTKPTLIQGIQLYVMKF